MRSIRAAERRLVLILAVKIAVLSLCCGGASAIVVGTADDAISTGGIVAITSAAAALLGSLFTFLLRRRRQANGHEIAMVQMLSERIKGLENKHDECLRQNALMEGKIGRLEASVAHLQHTMGVDAVALISSNQDGVITAANRGVTMLLGWAPRELVGQPISVLVPHAFRERHHAGFTKAREAGIIAVPLRDAFALAWDGHEVAVSVHLSSTMIGGERSFHAKITRKNA